MKVIAKVSALGFENTSLKPEDITKALEAATAQIVKAAESKLAHRAKEFDTLRREAASALEKMRQILSDETLEVDLTVQRNEPFTVSPRKERQEPIRAAREVAESNGNITNPQHRILAALADFNAIGRTAIPKSWIAARAGVSHSSGSYANNLGALRTLGLIDYPSTGMVSITPEGLSHTPSVDSPLTTDEMLQSCRNILTNPQAAILDVLHASHPKALSKDEVAEVVGVSATSGSFANNLGAIRSAGMIDYPTKGMVRCSDWLFID